MMQNLSYEAIFEFVQSDVIQPFYIKRLEKLNRLTFDELLKRKNPYLFKAKNIQTAEEFTRYILDAFLSSQEETIFGDLMEKLAIHICEAIFGGYKAEQGKFKSIDLIFDRDGKTYLVGIKSGPHWGNKDQQDAMKRNFKAAKELLRAEGNTQEIIAVNGCCYGKDSQPDKGEYLKLCGQAFWSLISGDDDLYMKIIEPLDEEAKQKDDMFKDAYTKKINMFTAEFLNGYSVNGEIDWAKFLQFVSRRPVPKLASEPKTTRRTAKAKRI